jgi:bifunctional DNA-binding transcriptional regulator/antitoxin component of YhaV-PrlF toxin-antitoxin module
MSETAKRPMRLRLVNRSYTVTIPKDVIAEARLLTGSWLEVAYDSEINGIVIKLSSSQGYTLASENKRHTKHAADIEEMETWLESNPNSTLDDYLSYRRSSREKAKGNRTEETN